MKRLYTKNTKYLIKFIVLYTYIAINIIINNAAWADRTIELIVPRGQLCPKSNQNNTLYTWTCIVEYITIDIRGQGYS